MVTPILRSFVRPGSGETDPGGDSKTICDYLDLSFNYES